MDRTRRLVAPALLALAVAVAGVAATVQRHDDRTDAATEAPTSSSTTSTTGAPTVPVTTTTAAPPTTAPSSTTTSPPPTSTTVPALRVGSTGPEVLALEQRLDGLGYFTGAVDGTYDADTAHGVTAFQKLAGLGRDGVVGSATEEALSTAVTPAPRSAEGRLLEVDLAHQVLLVVDGGKVHRILDVSTGKTAGLTPTGQFTLYRQIDGWRHAPLGVLYRPKYFYKGLAIHGYSSVPAQPASHGCIRVTNTTMDWLWSSGHADLQASLWIY